MDSIPQNPLSEQEQKRRRNILIAYLPAPCSICGEQNPLKFYYNPRGYRKSKCMKCDKSPNPVGRPRKVHVSCTDCGESDIAKFYVNSAGYRSSRCRRCDYMHEICWKYGISQEEYQIMLESQFGLCAICGRPPKGGRFCIDHCHSSGVVRALLCYPCNHMLGCAQDNPEILRKAIDYLKLHLT